MIVAESLNNCCTKYHCSILGFVLMPSHIHIVLFFEGKPQCSEYMRDFKKYTSRQIRLKLQSEQYKDIVQQLEYEVNRQHYKVWQTRFDAVVIRYSSVLHTKLVYIHNNPVKKGLVEEDWQWKWSSAAWYKNKGSSVVYLRHAAEVMY